MSAKYIFDYVADKTADNDVTLSLAARGEITETAVKNQVVHIGDDGSEEIITLSSSSIFRIRYPFGALTESDAGTVFQFWNSSSHGDGMAKTFKLLDPSGHVYVVRFDCDLSRVRKLANIHALPDIVFRVIGRHYVSA